MKKAKRLGAKRSTRPAARPSAAKRLYGRWWQRQSALYLTENPLCAQCLRDGRTTPASCVDHIIPHRGNQRLFRDTNNWQSLCGTCHGVKTARGQ